MKSPTLQLPAAYVLIYVMILIILCIYHTPSEKMAPHDLSSPSSPALDPEEIRQRKMAKRAKVIDELVKTESDFLTDLELCIREVLQPLRVAQVQDPWPHRRK